ncbi:MAG: chromate resistance protein [Polyangiaceae bacterium]
MESKQSPLRTSESPPRQARWLLLLPSVPTSEPSARVKVWRQLQAVGAVALKNSVYVLPNREECIEAFQWVARELVELGGQASLCEGQFFDGVTDDEIERRFVEARDAEFAELAEQLRALFKGLKGKRIAAEKVSSYAAQTTRIRRRFEEILATDYCHAPGREAAEGLLTAAERALAELRGGGEPQPIERAPRPTGATWVTRAGVHIDRVACAWLIQRFIDPAGRFKFVPAKGYLPEPGELRFDMYDAEFTHIGDRCTFEVLLARMGLDDPSLRAIGEIVHDIDLRDEKYARPETVGVASIITGICSGTRDDHARIEAATPIFEGLYAWVSRRARKTGQ